MSRVVRRSGTDTNVAMGTKARWWRRRRTAASTVEPTPQTAPPEAPVEPESALEPDRIAPVDRRWVRRYARVQVRAGIFDVHELRQLVSAAAVRRVADPELADELARQSLSAELALWQAEAERWLGRTDPERLDAALDHLRDKGVGVRAAVADAEDIAAAQRLAGTSMGSVGYHLAGIAGALRDNVLPLVLVNESGNPALRSGELTVLVQDALADEGLLASTDGRDGELVVPVTWRRRPRSLTAGAAEPSAEASHHEENR